MIAATPTRSRARLGQPASRWVGACLLLFLLAVTTTIVWSRGMAGPAMAGCGMRMPGGWTMSMTWMRMRGQSRVGAAASFLGMWISMMAAMMLPSLVPRLAAYRSRVTAIGPLTERRLDGLTAAVAAAYGLAWTAAGALLYPAGVAFSALAMRAPTVSRAVPLAAGLALVAAGIAQASSWKSTRLAACRSAKLTAGIDVSARAAWRHGLRLGWHCCLACAPLVAAATVLGVMDLGVMAAGAVAVSAERLLPHGDRVARWTGAGVAALGWIETARAVAAFLPPP